MISWSILELRHQCVNESLADCLGGKPRAWSGMQIGHGTSVHDDWQKRFARALAHGINVAKDFQSAPKDTGLQRSVTSVGQVRDRGNIITFTSTGGTILNEFTCNRIEFERSDGVYRWRADTSAWTKSGCR